MDNFKRTSCASNIRGLELRKMSSLSPMAPTTVCAINECPKPQSHLSFTNITVRSLSSRTSWLNLSDALCSRISAALGRNTHRYAKIRTASFVTLLFIARQAAKRHRACARVCEWMRIYCDIRSAVSAAWTDTQPPLCWRRTVISTPFKKKVSSTEITGDA